MILNGGFCGFWPCIVLLWLFAAGLRRVQKQLEVTSAPGLARQDGAENSLPAPARQAATAWS
ncbi:MAG: hypothetical protein ACLURG_14735 [Gemmiger sp.]